MSDIHVLVVEDESAVRELLSATLEGAGYQVTAVPDAHKARDLFFHFIPSLLLLDWMLPGMSGIELARWLKRDERLGDVPIIMLTAKDDENAKVQGLESGVDDYVTKPFSTRELLARIKAVLRRAGADERKVIRMDCGLELDLAKHWVSANNEVLQLGPTEFKLLHFFMTHPDRVYSRTQLLDLVWGRHVYIEERTVDVHIRRLRKILEPKGMDALVQTVRGVGYRFSEQ